MGNLKALLIGIFEYRHSLNNLSVAKRDIDALAEVLHQQSYSELNFCTVSNPTVV